MVYILIHVFYSSCMYSIMPWKMKFRNLKFFRGFWDRVSGSAIFFLAIFDVMRIINFYTSMSRTTGGILSLFRIQKHKFSSVLHKVMRARTHTGMPLGSVKRICSFSGVKPKKCVHYITFGYTPSQTCLLYP